VKDAALSENGRGTPWAQHGVRELALKQLKVIFYVGLTMQRELRV
jgi:hypothetical protein